MTITERVVNNVVILDIQGKMTLGDGDELLHRKIHSLVSEGRRKIILNLVDCPYIDSAGMAEITRSYTALSRQGGTVKLFSICKRIQDLLSITRLNTIFECFDNEQDALNSFRT